MNEKAVGGEPKNVNQGSESRGNELQGKERLLRQEGGGEKKKTKGTKRTNIGLPSLWKDVPERSPREALHHKTRDCQASAQSEAIGSQPR